MTLLLTLGVSGGSSGPAPLVLDTFTGSNGTLVNSRAPDIGTQPTGSSAIQIQSNAAQAVSNVNFAPLIYDFGGGNSDVTITVSITGAYNDATNYSTPDLAVRYTDDNNYWLIECRTNIVALFQRTAGTFTQRASNPFVLNDGFTYPTSVVLSGNTITFTLNGTQQFTYASATQGNTSTKGGLSGASGGTPATLAGWDNYRVTSP